MDINQGDKEFTMNAKFWVNLTLFGGVLIHLGRLVMGVEAFQRIFVWQLDAVLLVAMSLGVVFMIKEWKLYTQASKSSRNILWFTFVYFALSLPLHIRSIIAQDTSLLLNVPYWYGFVFLGYVSLMIYFWFRAKPLAPQELQPAQ
jgi:hypothetical protein